MTETYDSEILNCLKINEALWGWLSSFMSLACRLESLQKELLSKVWKIRLHRRNGSHPWGWSGVHVWRARWAGLHPSQGRSDFWQVKPLSPSFHSCKIKNRDWISNFSSALIFWLLKVPARNRIFPGWFRWRDFNKGTPQMCVLVKRTNKEEEGTQRWVKSSAITISMVKTPRKNGVTGTQWEPDLWRRAILYPTPDPGRSHLPGRRKPLPETQS